MTHKCEYCSNTIAPCAQPCHIQEKDHVCCTCNQDISKCELPIRIVCDNSLCNLKYTVDWYKIKLAEGQSDIAKLKALNNQFRIANIGSQAAQRLVQEGHLDITGIKVFVSHQRTTWEDIPIDTAYILMCLHEEFAKQWAAFLNEKAVKVQIKKELIQSTEAKLAKAQQIRDGKLNSDESPKKNTSRANLNPFEKMVLAHVKLGMSLEQTVAYIRDVLKFPGEVRPETKFNEFK